jgi:hypothetical protein
MRLVTHYMQNFLMSMCLLVKGNVCMLLLCYHKYMKIVYNLYTTSTDLFC